MAWSSLSCLRCGVGLATRKQLGIVLGLLSTVALALVAGYVIVGYVTLFKGLQEGVKRAIGQSSSVTAAQTGVEPSMVATTPAATSTTLIDSTGPGTSVPIAAPLDVWRSWNRVRVPHTEPDAAGFGRGEIRSITSFRGRLVGVGTDVPNAAVWVSGDGVFWVQVPRDQAAFRPSHGVVGRMQDVATWEGGLVVVGFERRYSPSGLDPVFWTSSDGVAWSRVPKSRIDMSPGTMNLVSGVASMGGRLVAVGTAGPWDTTGNRGGFDVAVWTSTDGQSWERVPVGQEGFDGPGSQGMSAVIAWNGSFVAVGGDGLDAAVWTSFDGVIWRQNRDIQRDRQARISTMSDVAAWDGGLVAVGGVWSEDSWSNIGDVDAAVWTSTDGITWRRIAQQDDSVFGGVSDQAMTAVAASKSAIVVVGSEGGGSSYAAVWASVDGMNWERVPHDSAVFGTIAMSTSKMESVIAWHGGFVAGGAKGVFKRVVEPRNTTVGLLTSPTIWTTTNVLPDSPCPIVGIVPADCR